jgi:hypothetical protein
VGSQASDAHSSQGEDDPGAQGPWREPLGRVLERDQGQPSDLARAIGLAAALGQVQSTGVV